MYFGSVTLEDMVAKAKYGYKLVVVEQVWKNGWKSTLVLFVRLV
jgi:hypothetical protein